MMAQSFAFPLALLPSRFCTESGRALDPFRSGDETPGFHSYVVLLSFDPPFPDGFPPFPDRIPTATRLRWLYYWKV
jgi:hypothetical protein